MPKKYDFWGYVTRNDLLCSDGRTIRKDAFKDNDGSRVALLYNHNHDDIFSVVGHADLKNCDDGVIGFCSLNDTEQGRTARKILEHGDIKGLSIYANHLKQRGSDVLHGKIQEVSIVLSQANPGAYIEDMAFAHNDEGDVITTEAWITSGEGIELYHADEEEDGEMALEHADNGGNEEGKTLQDVYDTLNDEQKDAVDAMLGLAYEDGANSVSDKNETEDEEDDDMKHNVFENDTRTDNYLSHSDEQNIVALAKQPGMTFQKALDTFAEQNGMELQHDAISSGFVQTAQTGLTIDALFPEYKDVRPGAPELITSDQGWISVVLRKVHKSPISRIRTSQVDIRNIDALRARGYEKGKQKAQTGNFQLVRRTTDPQTVYVKSALHRDDIVDITDFDYVQYLYNIDRMQLNEELATAIMLGDGREDNDAGKIMPEHIRPIWSDDELYTKHVDLDIAAMKETLQGAETGGYFGDNYVYSEALIEKVLYARETFKGTGTPDFFMTPHMLNVILLARDRNGRRIYSSKAELASSLNVGEIFTAEQFANKIRTDAQNNKHKLLGIICNLADYSLGSTKGGEITHFTQFDIDFNQEKSLLETRCSGALTRVYSAIAVEEPYTEG